MGDSTVSKRNYRSRRRTSDAAWTEDYSRPSVDVFLFRWSVPTGGFRWEEAMLPESKIKGSKNGRKEWVLTDGNPLGLPFMRRLYSPLRDHPALFRAFASLPMRERDGILVFANRFGTL